MKNNKLLKTGLLLLSLCASNCLYAQVTEETVPGTTVGNTGSIKFTYGGNQVTYTTVRAKDGNVWLQQNLGSANVAANQTDATSWGDLFQWGRWDDGHQLRTGLTTSSTTPSPNNPLGLTIPNPDPLIDPQPFYYNSTASSKWWAGGVATDKAEAASTNDLSATNGCDPCKKLLGGQWRLPTQTEWSTLITAEGITYNVNAFSSTLKIPSTTFRDGATGTLNANTNTTRLWSSTAGASGGAFVFSVTNVAASAAVINISRAQGYGIRCINTPLTTTPVGFINFKGKNGLGGIYLDWAVTSEQNNAFYTVKHSLDGVVFKDVATIIGKGNAAVQQTYTYLHQKPAVGDNYYKLLQTDFDGTQRELATIVVSNAKLENEKIAISTTDNNVKISLVGFNSKARKIAISSISGEIIYTSSVKENSITLPLILKKGIYIAQVEFENHTTKAVKFLR